MLARGLATLHGPPDSPTPPGAEPFPLRQPQGHRGVSKRRKQARPTEQHSIRTERPLAPEPAPTASAALPGLRKKPASGAARARLPPCRSGPADEARGELVRLPLRERGPDILLLADRVAGLMGDRLGVEPGAFSRTARVAMLEYAWPGNVRQLFNVIGRAIVRLGDSATIDGRQFRMVLDEEELLARRSNGAKGEDAQDFGKVMAPLWRDAGPLHRQSVGGDAGRYLSSGQNSGDSPYHASATPKHGCSVRSESELDQSASGLPCTDDMLHIATH